MRILWVSNAAFTNTGYGTGTRSVVPQLQKAGHEVAVLAYWGLQGAHLTIDGIEHFSPRTDQWGNDILEDTMRYFRADLAIIHRDIWVNDPGLAERLPIAAWFPIDSGPPLGEPLRTQMEKHRWMATMSRWGQEVAAAEGFKVARIPHSVDTQVFRYERRKDLRKQYISALPKLDESAFLVLIVAANKGFPSRKGFPEMFDALARFQRKCSDVYVHVHSLVTSEQGGPDLQRLARAAGMDLDRMSILNPFAYFLGLEPEDMARFYQMADVLLNTSYGEGFGIPILEAQACGTPVITTCFSSMPEITLNGYTVNGTLTRTPFYNTWMVPSVDEITAKLLHLYHRPPSEETTRGVAATIAANFSDEAVFETAWKPWLAQIEADLRAGQGGSSEFPLIAKVS